MKTTETIIREFSRDVDPSFIARECFGGAIYLPMPRQPLSSFIKFKEHLLLLPWITKRTARHELFMSDVKLSYSYGKVETETYEAIPFTEEIRDVCRGFNHLLGADFNACFLNKYDNEQQHLGWHADEFPGMREDQPIAVVSFGVEREIWLKDKRGFKCPTCDGTGKTERNWCVACGVPSLMGDGQQGTGFVSAPPGGKQPMDQLVKLEDGSLFIMPPGYQEKYLHRIPKHDRPCSWRISLTFRSFHE